jgi:methyl-accepting chemotaxis protein
MKLSSRFILLFSVIIITFALIGGYTRIALKKIDKLSSTEKKVNQLYLNSIELKNLEHNYSNWDLIDPVYHQTGISKNLQKFDSIIEKSISISTRLILDDFIASIKAKNDLLIARTNLENYGKTYNQYTLHKKEFGFKDWGIIGEMRSDIHNVETEINKMNLPQWSVHMLMLRRHEKDYLLRRDIKYKTNFENELSKFIKTIQQTNVSAHNKNEVLALLSDYHKTFMLLLEKDRVIGLSANEGLEKQLQEVSNATTAAIAVSKTIITSKIEKQIDKTMLFLIIFITVCMLASAAVALFIFRGIIKIMGGEPENVAAIAENVSNGKLKMDFDLHNTHKGMMKSVVHMAEKLKEIITNIGTSAEQISIGSQQFSNMANQISQGAYTQASSIDEISSSIEEIGRNIALNTQNARETNNIASFVKDEMHQINSNTLLSVKTGKAISDKVNIINTIANQTTILALNAAVEAARAGENGLGFHVIADEVKRLSLISKDAANEIIELTQQNLDLIQTVNKSVASVVEPIDKTSILVKKITEVSAEQEFATGIIVSSINQLNNISQENAAASEEMAANTTELEQQAQSLKSMIEWFEVKNTASTQKKKKQKNKKNKKSKLRIAS